MPYYLGIDTSNYTTSAAIYCSDTGTFFQEKLPLPVKKGQIGLRQNDTVFHHTINLPKVIEKLFNLNRFDISAVAASTQPRNAQESYMPCFLVGEANARSISIAFRLPYYATNHQTGHILAALFSSNKLELITSPFVAFHISGGTTEVLLVNPDKDNIIKCNVLYKTLDLNAGQVIDRVGKLLGIPFPAGIDLEKLCRLSEIDYSIKPFINNGNCSFSGLEYQCSEMLLKGKNPEDIAKYCIDYIATVLYMMSNEAQNKYDALPILYSGGVMSNQIVKNKLSTIRNAIFAAPELSSDNAVGIALYAFLKEYSK